MKKWQNEERPLFFLFLFFFCLPLFKTTKLCFGSTNMEISYREKVFNAEKKIRKNDFAPSKIFSCYVSPGQSLKCLANSLQRLQDWLQVYVKHEFIKCREVYNVYNLETEYIWFLKSITKSESYLHIYYVNTGPKHSSWMKIQLTVKGS